MIVEMISCQQSTLWQEISALPVDVCLPVVTGGKGKSLMLPAAMKGKTISYQLSTLLEVSDLVLYLEVLLHVGGEGGEGGPDDPLHLWNVILWNDQSMIKYMLKKLVYVERHERPL